MATIEGPGRPSSGEPSGSCTAVVVTVYGPVLPADIAGLCRRARAAVDGSHSHTLVCDVRALHAPDAVAVDALARIQLIVRRRGRRVVLRNVSSRLCELLELSGLCDAVGADRDDASG